MTKNQRQSPRIVLCIPLAIRVMEAPREAVTAVVNQHGALILAPVPYPVGTTLNIKNMKTHRSTLARVVWSGDPDAQGNYKIGIEFERRMTNFWERTAAAEE